MGEHMVDSQYSVNGDTVQARITFVPKIEDDGLVLRCEARNDAIIDPVVNTLVLDVDRVTTTTLEPEVNKEDSKVYVEDVNSYDEEATMYDQDTYEDYPDYGEDDYASQWAETYNLVESHPEETNEFTTRKSEAKHDILDKDIPTKSEDALATNFVHQSHQNDHIVDVKEDPDIKARFSQKETVRSGRQQGNERTKADELQSFESTRTSSSQPLRNKCIVSFAISIIALSLRF